MMASLHKCAATLKKSSTPPRRVRIVCISDTHEWHRELAVPDGDLLIHAGDFTFWNHASKIRDFNLWLGELPHRYKVIIPGNHDRVFNQNPRNRTLITNAVLLINESVRLCGLNIWGSPVTCDDAAYGYTRREDRARLNASIPRDTHILITHGPPYGILDREPSSYRRQGCTELRAAVIQLQPRLHVFEHVHGGYGTFQNETTLFVNAALLGPAGDLENLPISSWISVGGDSCGP
jgi:Icc-related predicted phosphoesterase